MLININNTIVNTICPVSIIFEAVPVCKSFVGLTITILLVGIDVEMPICGVVSIPLTVALVLLGCLFV